MCCVQYGMGVHICPYILKKKVTDDYGDNYWETEEYNGFDHIRYSGDRDFVTTNEIDWDEELDNPDGKTMGSIGRNYNRPKDIDKAIKWVKENVYKGNQERLINLLEEMRKNEKLFIYCSW